MISWLKEFSAPNGKAGIGSLLNTHSACLDQDDRYEKAANQRLSFALWVMYLVRPGVNCASVSNHTRGIQFCQGYAFRGCGNRLCQSTMCGKRIGFAQSCGAVYIILGTSLPTEDFRSLADDLFQHPLPSNVAIPG